MKVYIVWFPQGGDREDFIGIFDPKGVVVALYAKGKARKDTSGFVIG